MTLEEARKILTEPDALIQVLEETEKILLGVTDFINFEAKESDEQIIQRLRDTRGKVLGVRLVKNLLLQARAVILEDKRQKEELSEQAKQARDEMTGVAGGILTALAAPSVETHG